MRSSLKKLLALMVFIVVLVASISILNLRFPSYDFAFRNSLQYYLC
jgi:hypothetical protein